MTNRALLVPGLVALAVATGVVAAGPELSVGRRCDGGSVAPGAAVVVPLLFKAGVGDGGQLNAVSAADLAVTFADALTVTDVRLPGSLAASGSWTLEWDRTLGLPETPGRVSISVAPGFGAPVPTLPDGAIAEMVLTAAAIEQSRCVPIEIVAEAVVLSTPPLGLAIEAGPITNGGVAIEQARVELCDSCADEDGDGLVDLADPDCGAASIMFPGRRDGIVVKRKRDGDVVLGVRATLVGEGAIDGPLRLSVRSVSGAVQTCAAAETDAMTRRLKNAKKILLLGRDGRAVAKVVTHPGRDGAELTLKLRGLAVPAPSAGLSLSLWFGGRPFHVDARLDRETQQGEHYR